MPSGENHAAEVSRPTGRIPAKSAAKTTRSAMLRASNCDWAGAHGVDYAQGAADGLRVSAARLVRAVHTKEPNWTRPGLLSQGRLVWLPSISQSVRRHLARLTTPDMRTSLRASLLS